MKGHELSISKRGNQSPIGKLILRLWILSCRSKVVAVNLWFIGRARLISKS